MKNKILKQKKLLPVLVIAVLLLISLGVYTYSKYASLEQTGVEAELQDFSAVARVYYEQNGEMKEAVISTGDDNAKYIELTPEQFDTLKVDIEYTGKAKTYCRFKLDCSWLHQDTEELLDTDGNKITNTYYELIPHGYATYICDELVFQDYIEKDGWFYFTEILESEDGSAKTYPAITSVEDRGEDFIDPIVPGHESELVRISITVDCVQYNRVSALWKMNSLPWWSTTN